MMTSRDSSSSTGRVIDWTNANPTITEPLWTVDDVASYLRLKKETVRMMACLGTLPGIKIGRVWRFKASDIKEMLKNPKNRSHSSNTQNKQ